MRENRMEIANSNDFKEIEFDWEYLKNNVVPQIDKKIDAGEVLRDIDLVSLINKGINSL